MSDLTGKVIIVTGGTQGIGEAVARKVAEAGALHPHAGNGEADET